MDSYWTGSIVRGIWMIFIILFMYVCIFMFNIVVSLIILLDYGYLYIEADDFME